MDFANKTGATSMNKTSPNYYVGLLIQWMFYISFGGLLAGIVKV